MRRSLEGTLLLLLLAACAAEEGSAPPPPDGGGGAGGSRCGLDEALIDGICRPLCPDGLPPDDEGRCGQFCQPQCEGKFCLADDGCGALCESSCVQVTNLTDPAAEAALAREVPCFAWDDPSSSFLLQGGRRNTFEQARLGPGVCELAGRPDDVVTGSDGVASLRATYCGLDPSCWTTGCAPPDGWSPVDACENCFLDDTWRLSEEAPGEWRWSEVEGVAVEPHFEWDVQCLSAGEAGVLARGAERDGSWSSWRWSNGAWKEQADDDVPRPFDWAPLGVRAWQPDCGRPFGCEVGFGGCPFAGVSSDVRWIDVDGRERVEPIDPALWRNRVKVAAAGTPEGVYLFGGSDLAGTCYGAFEAATMETLNDLLFWDGATMRNVDAIGDQAVTPREGAQLAALGDRLVLFGGRHPAAIAGQSSYPGELCEFEAGDGWACRYMADVAYEEARGVATTTRLPRPRNQHALASGFGRDGRPVVVLFGGSEVAPRGDTWLFALP
jgi:hypothetical protein